MNVIDSPRSAVGRPRDPGADAALIGAVLDLINEGATLSGLSFVTVAERAGVSRNSLYRRWKTKDALYLDVLASINRPILLSREASAHDDVVALLRHLIERVQDQRASRLLRALAAEAALFPELHRRYVEEILAPRREMLRNAIARGVDTGELRDDVDLDVLAELLESPIIAHTTAGAANELNAERASHVLTDLVFFGAAPRGGVAFTPPVAQRNSIFHRELYS